jgi:NADH-quinone oxidoreductase subunit E
MLSPEEKKEIDAELAHAPQKRSACIEGLKIIQRHRGGWVSDDALRDVAEYLDMSVADLESVATFYSLIFRKPVGRHVILICDSISCWITGYLTIVEYISEKLGIRIGETTEDNKYTLLTIPCLGACDHAPVMIIDTDTHRDLTPEKVDKILESYE